MNTQNTHPMDTRTGWHQGTRPNRADRTTIAPGIATRATRPMTSTIAEHIGAERLKSLLPAMLAPIYGGDVSSRRGYHTAGDLAPNVNARVTETIDGISLQAIWKEQSAALAIANETRTNLASLLSCTTTDAALAVPQGPDAGVHFESASEFGVPSAYRPNQDYLRLGLPFKDWDTRSAYTWQFLRDASAEQVAHIFDAGLEADNRLTTGSIFNRLFSPAPAIADDTQLTVYGLYNGTDGMKPPTYNGQDFSASTSHYFTTGSAALDSKDIEDAMKLITSKGFGTRSSQSTLLIIGNETTLEPMLEWRRGIESRALEGSETSAPTAKYDFVLSAGAPAYLSDETVIGQIAPAQFQGLDVLGSYGPAMAVTSHLIPAGTSQWSQLVVRTVR
ncbi:putative protein OS=Tsukamurella paurometabola (strain ATCC 8368 / DSM / CCUG 35730 /CIP 100753 / JCM 10117 / KCTC 9821 / NBRC 16120 / NCIMB 702349/ NCTC 13040) OX=521096 GN=Tpau_1432 PE=4 SV=1 [Tsukamurella paurometabola]